MSEEGRPDRVRDPVWEQLRAALSRLPETADVEYKRRGWRVTVLWPAPGPQREQALARVRKALYAHPGRGELTVWPAGWLHRERILVKWPEAAGLFDPPGPGLPEGLQAVAPGPTGELALIAEKPCKASERCAEHVLELLREENRRMTAQAIQAALDARKIEWSSRVVEATCSWLVHRGELSKGRCPRGSGYGLREWD